ncbi:translocation/assembly module TamB domain-containing protein [Methyloglobulus sp.]|uniref:translocation/assembly module TamB domain-containing protein n=1 Tax=Methyloglobulus sp. TaxID=2518622 RepID=UPI0032B772A5
MKKRFLQLLLVLALVIPIAVIGLFSNETGSRWLLQGIFSSLPGKVSVENIQGRLLDRIALTGLSYKSDTEIVTIKNIDLSWQPSQIFSGTLKIVDLTINGLNISISITKTKEEKEPTNMDAGINLPIQLDIGKILVTDVHFTSDGQLQTLDKLQLSVKTEGNKFKLLSLTINSDKVNATANGTVSLVKAFPLSLQAEWRVNADKNGVWQGSTTIRGDLYKLLFDNQLASPFKLDLKGHVEDVFKTPRLKAQGNWQGLAFPFAASLPQIQSEEGHLELEGLLTDYHLTVNGQLNQQYVPQALLSFDGKGGLDGIHINKLELKSKIGLFQLTGNASWGNVPEFNLTATGQQFNPAIIIADLPGSLTFSSHLKGKIDPKAIQITADIDKLSGQLRNQALNANGKLALNGDQLKVDSFLAALGANKVTIDGLIGQTNGNLVFVMDIPTLGSLWPNLGGSLKGNGDLHGGWKNPTVKFDAEGKGLKFAEHSLNGLSVNLDYHPDDQKISTINVSADAIKSGTTQIDKLSIKGKGTPKQHGFNIDINSSKATISTVLKGSLATNYWKGDISKLGITLKDGKSWSLKDNVPLRVEKKPLGFDVALAEGCLVQEAASLCTQGSYLANGDLGFQLLAKALPTNLAQAYLPEQVRIESLINANVDIQRKKNLLNGSYRVATTPAQVFLSTKKTKQEIHLGASSLSGNIKGDKVSADIDLLLAGHDYLQGQLVMDIGKTQTISGTISASIAEFSLIKPFAPEISDIKGLLKADLSLQGPIKKPLVSGHIDVTDGLADMGKMGLHDIDLHVVASGNRSNGIHIQGSTVPIVLNKPDSSEKINLKTKINLDADLQIQDVIAGNFSLALPDNTILSLETQGTKKEIVLGATSLSGLINGESLSADLNMTLIKQDYLRAKLQMVTGKTQALSAQATASIREFAMIEPFAPQLSNIKGLLKANFTVKGTVQNPLVNGDVHLTNGDVTVDKLGLNVRDINLQAVASAEKADLIQINGFAKSGEGLINLSGTVSLQPELHYPVELDLTGKDFEVAKIPEAQIAVSPDLKIALNDQQKQISGELAVPKAILKIQDIPENAVKVSEDEIILGEEKVEISTQAAPEINADIEVKLGKQVSFTGQGLQTNLVGNLKIIKTGEKMVMQGNVDMVKASYKRFGQDLTVRKGRFLFNGPADNPWLDVEAIRLSKSKKVTAILALTGSLKNPQTHISAEPSLPESEALAYLVTGAPLNQVSKSDSNMLASAALSYGAGKVTWLADKLGIDEFNVEEGKTLQDSLLVMGQYLTPDFYVGTKVGMFNKQANLVLKHKLTDTINVETQAGTSQRIKLNYEFDGD